MRMRRISDWLSELIQHIETNNTWNSFSRGARWLTLILLGIHHGVTGMPPDVYVAVSIGLAASAAIVLISELISLIFSHRYTINRLFYDRDTGVLEDQQRRFRNVSLRTDSVSQMIDAILSDDEKTNRLNVLTECAKHIGTEFAHTFMEKLSKVVKQKGTESVLNSILEYDSSSGMGLISLGVFDAGEHETEITIRVESPFSEVFLESYLVGICSEVAGRPFGAERYKVGKGAMHVKLTG